MHAVHAVQAAAEAGAQPGTHLNSPPPPVSYSLCVHKHALGLHTTQKGPKCPSNDRVRNAPSTQGPRHVPRAWHCFGKAYPLLFFLFWLCSCYSPCTKACPWSGAGTTCQLRTALLMHHGRPAFLPILPCCTRPKVPFEEAFAGMPPLDGVLVCSACCCRLYHLSKVHLGVVPQCRHGSPAC